MAKKAGRKKPGPKKGWKLKGIRKAANQGRSSALKRAAKKTTRRVTASDQLGPWLNRVFSAAEASKHSVLIDIGRGRALSIKPVRIS